MVALPDVSRPRSLVKRLFDLTIILLAAPLLVAVSLVTAVLVRVFMGSPVLFRQVRPGLHGRPFTLLKFRTMNEARDADGALRPDDQRLPAFGRFLRSTSFDELPEVINVVRGEMSLVGPRPLLMEYLPLYSMEQARRHDVLPGVTGWAQINGRNAIDWTDKLRLDVWYVDHRSLALDFRILCITLAKVLRRSDIAAKGQATTTRFTGEEG